MFHRARQVAAIAVLQLTTVAMFTTPSAQAATPHTPFFDRLVQRDLAVIASRVDAYAADHAGSPPPNWWIAPHWQGTGAAAIDYWHNDTAYCLGGHNSYGTLTNGDQYWRGTDLPQTIATFEEIQAGGSPCAQVLADPVFDNTDPNPPTIDGGVPGAMTGAEVTGFVVSDIKHLVGLVRRYHAAHGTFPSIDWAHRRTRVTGLSGSPVYIHDRSTGQGYCIETHNSNSLLNRHQFMWFGNGMDRILIATLRQARQMNNVCGRMLRASN